MRRTYQLLFLSIILIILATWIVLPGNSGIHALGINKDFQTVLGLDLQGGVQALLEADIPEDVEIDSQSLQTAIRIVENRVNGLGVTEAVVQQAGDRRIVVELPGHENPETAINALKQTGLMEFVDMSGVAQDEIYFLQNSNSEIITDQSFDQSSQSDPDQNIFPSLMTGAVLKNAYVTTDEFGDYVVAFELNDEGAELFSQHTGEHIGDILAIVLDKKIISAPVINDRIPDGLGIISGDFTFEEANTLAVQLRYGSLPIPLKVVETRTVGPSLGRDSLNKSLVAGVIGFGIVILFMAIYYRLPGIVADVSIIIYAVITFAIFRFIPVTLTLPGIAGFLLSTGSALDANILIFERIKEELRAGRDINSAMSIGWRRAWSSIRDSNFATLITCGILFWFGSQFGATIVKGFSITLALGVLVSVFTAIVVTRALLALIFHYFKPNNLDRWFGL